MTSTPSPSPTVLLEGFLQKQSGGLFLKKKQKWAVLRSDGTLSLSKKPELPASSVIKMYEMDNITYRDEDSSIAFSSVHNGSIIKAYKFYALETPTFEDWTVALDKVREEPSPEYVHSRSKYRQSISAIQRPSSSSAPPSVTSSATHPRSLLSPGSQKEDARVTITDEALEKPVDPVLLIQSSGEGVSKAGYIKKRGGAYGGNTSYKKRFFVLTIFGRVIYFADQKKTQALGQFSLLNASIQHVKQQEISVVTPTRVWFLKFDSEASRVEWSEKIESIAQMITAADSASSSSSPSRSPSLPPPPSASSLPPPSQQHPSPNLESFPTPRFHRNMSLLVRQKSNFDGLGYSSLNEKKSSNNNIASMLESSATPSQEEEEEEEGGGGGTGGRRNLSSVSVACVTWNLSESLPKMQQCRFLRQYRKQQIVVVGVQECQSVMYHSFSARQLSPLDIWLAMVKGLMGEPFTLVASRSMGAIHVCVFVRKDIIGSISDVNTAFVPCGLGNVMYNKGAVAVSLKCNHISFGFVCAHLAANQEKTIERNLDFHRISLQVVDQLGKVACVRKRKNSVIALERNKTHRQAGLFVVMDDRDTAADVYTDDDPNTSNTGGDMTAPPPPRSTSPPLSPQLLHKGGRYQAAGGAGTGTGGGGSSGSGSGSGNSGAQTDSHDALAREFDRCFFMGDLNYRVDAGKEWVETYLRMAEKMRQLEKQAARDVLEAAAFSAATTTATAGASQENDNDKDNEISETEIINGSENENENNALVVMCSKEEEEEVRSSEKKIEKMLNLIQVGDYGTDDEDDSDDDFDCTPSNSPYPSPSPSPSNPGSEVGGGRFGRNRFPEGPPVVSLQTRQQTSSVDIMENEVEGVSLDHLREPTPKNLTPRHVPTSEDMRDLQAFKEETKLTTSHSVFAFLLTYDQLCREIGKATVFRGFVEGPIQFKCSYKFDPFTETYDTSRKARSPAWCDRVLYTSPIHTKLDQYRCIHGKFHSDHRAVAAIFTVDL